MLKVEGNNSLLRDEHSKAIINMDENAHAAYLERRKALEVERNRINSLTIDVYNLKDRMTNIETLLTKILEKL